jgi:hypothetical protein
MTTDREAARPEDCRHELELDFRSLMPGSTKLLACDTGQLF